MTQLRQGYVGQGAAENRAVFLSYASQDAEAARRICDSLRSGGVEVWFDADGGLEHGDEWDAKIRRQIKECVLFIPVISANTQARHEGYFRIEWELAAQRAMGIASGVPFILPVVIDDTREPDALVPDRFRMVQWTKLRAGEVPPEVQQRFLKLWSHRTGVLKHEAQEVAQASSLPSVSDAGWKPALPKVGRRAPAAAWGLAAIAAALAVGGFFWLKRPSESGPISAQNAGAGTRPPTMEKSTPLSAARQLADKARAMFDSLDGTRDDYKLAEELVAQAKVKDATDAEVCAVEAQLHERYIQRGWDTSDARREAARAAVQRAVRLDPQSFEVRWAQASLLNFTGREGEERTRQLRELRRERPADQRILRALATGLDRQGQLAEAAAIADESAALPGGDPLALYSKSQYYWFAGRTTDAETAIEAAIAQKPFTGALLMSVWYKTILHGDLDGARALLNRIDPADLIEDRAAYFGFIVEWLARRPDAAIARLAAVPRDWLNDSWYRGPKGLLVGDALQLAGRPDAAAVERRAALKLVEQRLAADQNNLKLLYNRFELVAKLGQREEAERLFAVLTQMGGTNAAGESAESASASWACVLLGRKADAIRIISAGLKRGTHAAEFTAATLRLGPEWDPLRSEPEFAAIVAEAERIEKAAALPRGSGGGAAMPPAPDAKSVAVLAFANLSDDKANEYFSDGISEELLNVLAKIPDLKVTARTSSFHFKGKDTPIPEIARQLGVAYVVEGSVRKSGDKVRITAQLIKAADGFHMWSDTFTRDLKDIFAVQDEIAGLIAKNLQLKIGLVSPAVSVDPEAFRLLLAGRAKIHEGGNANRTAAIAEIRRAVEIAPNYAAAWAELARAFIQDARAGTVPLDTAYAEARPAVQRAVALEPDSPDVLVALGWVRRTADWDWRGAEQAFRRAMQLQPNHAGVVADASVTLNNLGHIEESIQLGRRATELDPLNSEAFYNLSMFLGNARRLEESAVAAQRAVELAPRADGLHRNLSNTLADLGRFTEASREAELDPDETNRIQARALILLRQGKKTEALGMAQALEHANNSLMELSELYALAGDPDRAFATLEKAFARRETGMVWLKVDSYLESLHADPRWTTLLRKINLADDQLK